MKKLIIDISEKDLKEFNSEIVSLATIDKIIKKINNGVLLEDFLKRRKEPIDKNVVDSYLKENKNITLTDKQFDTAKMLSTKNEFTDELIENFNCGEFFKEENKE